MSTSRVAANAASAIPTDFTGWHNASVDLDTAGKEGNPRPDYRDRTRVDQMFRGFLVSVAPSAAAAAAAAAAIPTIAATTAAAAPPTAFGLGARFVDVDGASADLRTVQSRNGLLSILVARHLYETEPARASGVAVGHDAYAVHLSVRLKKLPQFVFVGVEAQIPYENILQASASALSCRKCKLVRRTWQVGRAFPENRNRSWRTVNCGQKYSRFSEANLSNWVSPRGEAPLPVRADELAEVAENSVP